MRYTLATREYNSLITSIGLAMNASLVIFIIKGEDRPGSINCAVAAVSMIVKPNTPYLLSIKTT
jgi:hypothetical protein